MEDHHDEGLSRYIVYISRLGNVLSRSTRYLAYSSDLGEAVRPVVNKKWVQACYMISWGYVGFDVASHAGHVRNSLIQQKTITEEDRFNKYVVRAATERFAFQVLASMLLPAFTIHSAVTFLTKQCVKRPPHIQKWAPTLGGLAIVPFLPFLFDHPIEHGVETVSNYLLGPSPNVQIGMEEGQYDLKRDLAERAEKAKNGISFETDKNGVLQIYDIHVTGSKSKSGDKVY